MNDKLWTKSFISICAANFLLFFTFYLLLPILPLYLIEEFHTSKSVAGLVLATYTVAALMIRPLAAFVLDMVVRKPAYVVAFFVFIACFGGYLFAGMLALFVLVRVVQGAAFGFVTTAGNSLVIDIMPPARRGEGMSWFGVANNLAMAFGPMISLPLHTQYGYDFLFYLCLITGFLGVLLALNIKSDKVVERTNKLPVAFDRFYLPNGLTAGICFMLTGIPYAMVSSYIPLYGINLGLENTMGWYFSLMAVGLVASRLFSGKMVDKGHILRVIGYGTGITLLCFFVLSSLKNINESNHFLAMMLFYGTAIIMGFGYGLTFPAYNFVFINLAPHNKRASASSTYMTSWDVGIGLGLIIGGRIADSKSGMPLVYLFGAMMILLSLILFLKLNVPHYNKNKLR
ncbi:putative transmembrane transport protein [uncultured Paludibacter sp.]|uniref:Putative transmembrane transport protein n=1 Tax=uncultured Paludibacter sp. TaxID=497635 RepID=A0A653ADJ8_9BACT|nr:putative transmembrane transport protein [uncultured Paludibacter sp.]